MSSGGRRSTRRSAPDEPINRTRATRQQADEDEQAVSCPPSAEEHRTKHVIDATDRTQLLPDDAAPHVSPPRGRQRPAATIHAPKGSKQKNAMTTPQKTGSQSRGPQTPAPRSPAAATTPAEMTLADTSSPAAMRRSRLLVERQRSSDRLHDGSRSRNRKKVANSGRDRTRTRRRSGAARRPGWRCGGHRRAMSAAIVARSIDGTH
jgi:hypothetical protein